MLNPDRDLTDGAPGARNSPDGEQRASKPERSRVGRIAGAIWRSVPRGDALKDISVGVRIVGVIVTIVRGCG